MNSVRTSKRPLKFGLPPHLEATYGDRLVEIMEWLKTKIRLHGYFVSREIIWPTHVLSGKPIHGYRYFQVGRDPFNLVEEPTVIDIHLTCPKRGRRGETKVRTHVELWINVRKEDVDHVENALWRECDMTHEAVMKMLDRPFDELRRSLLWDLRGLMPNPSPKHWWPKKPAESKLENGAPPA